MIYLILSPAFKDKNDISKGYKSILKIGYTGENSRKSRFDCYLTENPYSKILYLIEGGDLEDERNLHIYFKEYKDKYGKEWFEYNQVIIDFFETHKTKESLQEISEIKTDYTEKELREINIKKSNKKIEIKANFITNEIISTFYTKAKTIEESKKMFKMVLYDILFNFDKIEDYLIDTYGENFSILVLSKLDKSLKIDDVNKELDTIYSMTYLQDKYKYLCSLSESVVLSLLPHLPESFNNYYTVLGLEKMKALGYNATDIKKEYEGIMGNQNIDIGIGANIYEEFIVGERYTKTYIKDRLGTLYKELGYSKSPKATDLEDYFIIKNCMIRNKETGKRDNCYEIIGIKKE